MSDNTGSKLRQLMDHQFEAERSAYIDLLRRITEAEKNDRGSITEQLRNLRATLTDISPTATKTPFTSISGRIAEALAGGFKAINEGRLDFKNADLFLEFAVFLAENNTRIVVGSDTPAQMTRIDITWKPDLGFEKPYAKDSGK